MMHQRISTKVIPPVPPEFENEFVAGGWRRVERLYGARTDRLMAWIERSGGETLFARRRAALVTAVKPGAGKE
jgi:hypothetical protein